MKKTDISTENFQYIKLDESIEFICYRCKKRKITKKYVEYDEDNSKRRICNACYGFLKSNTTNNK